MMGDAIDGAFEDDEDESDAIMSQVRCGLLAHMSTDGRTVSRILSRLRLASPQVLDEIGIDLSTELSSAPKHRAANTAQQQSAEDKELKQALAALKS